MTRRAERATAVGRCPRHRAKRINGRPMPEWRGRFIAPAETGEPEL